MSSTPVEALHNCHHMWITREDRFLVTDRLADARWGQSDLCSYMAGGTPRVVSLRATEPSDLRTLFENGNDPEANAHAGTKPRTWETFEPKWLELMQDETATMRVILADRVMVGAINVLMMDGEVSLGYWLGRQFWGQGIASAAVGLMLTEVTTRPLHASAAGHNLASIRVLLKHGFVETSRRWTGETERTIARETVTFVLQ